MKNRVCLSINRSKAVYAKALQVSGQAFAHINFFYGAWEKDNPQNVVQGSRLKVEG